MTTGEIIKIVFGIIASLGGGGAIILGLSNYFGNILAKRYEEKVKTNFQKEINEYQNQLDILKQVTLRYSDKQFEYYSILWASLFELKLSADDLWQKATTLRLSKFSSQLKLTKIEVEKSSLFIEENHYAELMEILRRFSEYQIGKSDLIDYRKGQYFEDHQVNQMIAENGNLKTKYDELIITIKKNLKKQIGGNVN